jgi:hypothetical protein
MATHNSSVASHSIWDWKVFALSLENGSLELKDHQTVPTQFFLFVDEISTTISSGNVQFKSSLNTKRWKPAEDGIVTSTSQPITAPKNVADLCSNHYFKSVNLWQQIYIQIYLTDE